MSALISLLRLPAKQRAVALEAALSLALARALVQCVPMRYWRGSLNAAAVEGADPVARRAAAHAVGRMVRRVARRLPFDAVCLPRAMSAHWMLRRRGISSRLVFGVRRASSGGNRHYHAWLTVDGEFVVGGRGAGMYAPLPLPETTRNRQPDRGRPC